MIQLNRRTALKALALPAALPLAALATGCSDSWESLPKSTLTIATGNRGGVFSRYGDALTTVLNRELSGVTAETRATNASVENVHLVAKGTCDIGLSLGDTASDAVRGSGGFDRALDLVALARTYDSFVQLVVRADGRITDVADLRGRSVGIGAPGSGTQIVARRILQQAGLNPTDIKATSESLEASADALRAGSLAAFFFVSGIPNQAVLTLSQDTGIRLVPLDGLVSGMVDTYGPEYVGGPIPASTYALPDGVDTVSVKNYVVAHRDMPSDLAYAVTRVMFEAQDEIDKVAPGVRQPTLGAAIFTSPLDLHPGAVRYYRERKP